MTWIELAHNWVIISLTHSLEVPRLLGVVSWFSLLGRWNIKGLWILSKLDPWNFKVRVNHVVSQIFRIDLNVYSNIHFLLCLISPSHWSDSSSFIPSGSIKLRLDVIFYGSTVERPYLHHIHHMRIVLSLRLLLGFRIDTVDLFAILSLKSSDWITVQLRVYFAIGYWTHCIWTFTTLTLFSALICARLVLQS